MYDPPECLNVQSLFWLETGYRQGSLLLVI